MDPDPAPANFVCDLQDVNKVFGLLIFEGTFTSLLSKKGNLFFALDLYGLFICSRMKLDCWWHLMQLLGENLPHHAVEVVQVPTLLQYCIFVTDNNVVQGEFPTSHPSGPLFSL
jgi:hypothetical protein